MKVDWYFVGPNDEMMACSAHRTGYPKEDFTLMLKQDRDERWRTHIFHNDDGRVTTMYQCMVSFYNPATAVRNAHEIAHHDQQMQRLLYGENSGEYQLRWRLAGFTIDALRAWGDFIRKNPKHAASLSKEAIK